MTVDAGRRGWTVVGGAFVGVACGATVLVPYTFGYLMAPLAREMGWERSQFASAISVYMLTMLVLLPFAGRVIDRIGARRAASGSLLAMAAVFAAMGWLIRDLRSLHAGYAVLALSAVCASPLSYARAITSWFDRRRGLALGIALCGVGLGTALLPPFVRACVEIGGGRAGFFGIAALLALVAAPVVWFTVGERPSAAAGHRRSERGAFIAAMRSRHFWQMFSSFFLLGLGISGIVPLMPTLLGGRGAEPTVAIQIQAALGISSIVGRPLGGWLMDKLFAPFITTAAALCAAVGLLLLPQVSDWGLMALVVGICLGLATGMESDVIAYLSSRYFSPAVFSSVLGVMMAAYIGGAAIGPMVLTFGERIPGGGIFVILAGLLVVAAALQIGLGRYRVVAQA